MKQLPHNQIDQVIHQRTRLAIMAALSGVQELDFNDLKAQLGLTDGNLSTHLAALEKAEYVEITKSFKGKKPRTTVTQTPRGQKAMGNYIQLLNTILDQTR